MESSKIKLGYRERDKLFKKEYSELKIKVALNWFEVFALLAVSFFISLKLLSLLNWDSILLPIIVSGILGSIVAYLFGYFRKYQLKITRFDKENIYKKISTELINETKNGE